jgi:hypothetical protein
VKSRHRTALMYVSGALALLASIISGRNIPLAIGALALGLLILIPALWGIKKSN